MSDMKPLCVAHIELGSHLYGGVFREIEADPAGGVGQSLDLLLLFPLPAWPGGLVMLAHQRAHLVIR